MLPTILEWFTESAFLLAIDATMTEEALARIAGAAPGSYGAELAERLIGAVFGGLVDLEAEYDTFYRVEYSSFLEFLTLRYNLQKHDAEAFEAARNAKMRVAHGDLRCGGDYSIVGWVEWAGGGKVLRSIIGCPGDPDEDSM